MRLRILVYEHVSGGGFAGKPIPTGVLSEGYAMLRVAVSGFKSAGHSVATMLDSRIAALGPPLEADRVVPIRSSGDIESVLQRAAESADAALVVAPESGNVLRSLVEAVESTGAASLNCRSTAIAEVADKAALCERARLLGLSAPETVVLDVRGNAEGVKRAVQGKFSFPLVVKPLVAEGGGGLSLVSSEEQLAAAVARASREPSSEHCIAQEFVQGVAASVSLISTGGDVLPVSLNWQNIALGAPEFGSSYEGGFVPLESPLRAGAFAAAKKVVKSFGGLVGCVGVDVVLAEDKVTIIEVNPRLTTSIVGVSRVANFNLSQAVLDAALKGKLPSNAQNSGFAFFSKVPVSTQISDAFLQACKMDEVISPPFPLGQDGFAHALLMGGGATLKGAVFRFREAKKRLQRVSRGGG